MGGLACAPMIAEANGMVSMELTGVAGPQMGGVDTSPYEALIGPPGLTSSTQFNSSNSIAMQVICDDFTTDVGLGHTWQATVTNMAALAGLSSPLTTLKFDTTGSATQQQQDYMAAAWLAEQLLDVNQSTTAGEQEAGQLSFAIWGIFDPGASGALSQLSGANLTAAQNDITDAYDAVAGDNPLDFANFRIYTPVPLYSSQEFLAVSPVPEPGALALYGLGILGLGLTASRRPRAPRTRA
jgi:PEP-CTERM motif